MFVYGTCYEVLNYTANGGSSDWFYGEQTTKNTIIEFSPEAGDPLDGFWPAADQILPMIVIPLHSPIRTPHQEIMQKVLSLA